MRGAQRSKPLLGRLPSSFRIGTDYFAERGLEGHLAAPKGLVDSLHDLASDDCDTTLVPHEVRRFFEDTGSLELRIVPSWRVGVGVLARIFVALMRRVGQFVQPLGEAVVETRMVSIDSASEGNRSLRGVVRTYAKTGSPMQIVGYARGARNGAPELIASFPLPFGNLVGVLRLELVRDAEGAAPCGARLTSKRRPGHDDETGVWLVWGRLRIPLPLSETMSLAVASPEDARGFEGTTIVGQHDQWLFGIRVVRYAYSFRPARPKEV